MPLRRAVSSAHHDDGLVFEEETIAGGAIRYAVTGILGLAGNAELAVLRTGGDDDGIGVILASVAARDGLGEELKSTLVTSRYSMDAPKDSA